MKKKTVKKLELAKETVRHLEKGELEKVAGGASWDDCTFHCSYTCGGDSRRC
jgi:hypothetical protein